jgi:hypothetical protein
MKEILNSVKKNAWVWSFFLIFGFSLGNLITYNNIIADCEVLGMFRVGNHGAQCYIHKVPAKEPAKEIKK